MTYVNPRSVGLCGALLPIVGTVVVALRFRTRYAKRIGIGADDWVCVPALGGDDKLCNAIDSDVLSRLY